MKLLLHSLLLVLLAISGRAQSIYLDDTWGDTGVVITDGVTSSTTTIYGLLVLPDGGVLAAGAIDDTAMVIKYLENGTIDNTFGVNGIFRVDQRGYFKKVVQQPDGRLVAVGAIRNDIIDSGLVVRLMPDGTHDAGFASNGELHFSFAGGGAVANGVALRPDSKMLVHGASDELYPGLMRLKANGTPDSSFCDSGILILPNIARLKDCITLPDGRIACGGGLYGAMQFVGIRLTASGAFDTTYNHTGIAYCTAGAGASEMNCAVVQPDGKIVVGGYCYYGSQLDNFTVVRFDTSGALDDAFGDTGVVNVDFGNTYDNPYGLALTADGDILMSGHAYNGATATIATIKLNSSGHLVPSFGVGGKVVTDVGPDVEHAWCVTQQPDGKVIVGGYSYNTTGTATKLTSVRYKTDPTAVPANVHTSAISVFPNPTADLLYIKSQVYPLHVGVTDMFGRKVLYHELNDAGALNCSQLLPGLYVVDITCADGARQQTKLRVVR